MKKWKVILAAMAITLAASACGSNTSEPMDRNHQAEEDAEKGGSEEVTAGDQKETEKQRIAETEKETEEETVDYTGLVSDKLNETIALTIYGSPVETKYKVPVINWEGDEIKTLNQKILDKYGAYYNNTCDNKEEGYYSCCEVNYSWSVDDNLLTLIVRAHLYPEASGWIEPEVFTVDLKNNHVMSKADVLAYFGMSGEEYASVLKSVLEYSFRETYKGAFSSGGISMNDSFVQKQYQRTFTDENVNACVPYVIDRDHLGVYAWIYSIAAGDHYPQLLNVTEIYGDGSGMTALGGGNAGGTGTGGNVASGSGNAANAGVPGDYILPNSSTALLTESDLAGLSKDDIQLAINEIYARHGRKFKNENVRNYFESKSWYKGTIESNAFSESVFSDIEAKNVDFLTKHR